MNDTLHNCPHCGRHIIAGAMRCAACGRILKTPEDQIASIDKLCQKRKKFNIGKVFKVTVTILMVGIFYNYFSEQINELINSILGIF